MTIAYFSDQNVILDFAHRTLKIIISTELHFKKEIKYLPNKVGISMNISTSINNDNTVSNNYYKIDYCLPNVVVRGLGTSTLQNT